MARPSEDMIGKTYGRLTVLNQVDYDPKRYTRKFRCKCTCGNIKDVWQNQLRRKTGGVKSCGCALVIDHTTHGGSKTRLYRIWQGMKGRCSQPTHINWSRYGGAGIRVCDTWQDFEPFREWAFANGYTDTLTIDRIKGTIGYKPANCRWATYLEQAQNRRSP